MSKLNIFGFITKCICDIAVGRTNKVFLYKFMFIVRAFTICVVAMGLVFTSNLCLADDETEVVFEIDAEIEETGNIAYELNSLNYCASEDFIETEEEIAITAETESVPTNIGYNRGSADTRIKDFCKKLKEVRELEGQLSDNMSALEDNARAMKDKEQSIENRALGAIGAGTVGIGGMMAASALSEQKADDEAATDMAAYLATFRCTYAGGKSVKGGNEPIELPGGNDKTLMELRNEYIQLAASLKERKESLGIKPGIESEEILDKAEMGLYDDENVGITQSAYASLYRAQTGNAEDQSKIDAAKESTNKKLKIGATVAVAGAAVTAIGNYALNHNNKNKSEELAAKRRKMKDEYAKLAKELIDECNKTIQDHKDVVKSLPAKVFENPKMKQYRQDVQNAKSINSLDELKESVFCK